MANNYVDNIKKKLSGIFYAFDIHDKRFPDNVKGTANTTTLLTVDTDGIVGSHDVSPSITDTDGTSSAGPKLEISVAGVSSSKTELNKASTSVYGVTKLSSTASSTEETLAATPKGVQAAINALDYSDTADSTKYVSEVDETDGKISVTRASFSPSISITAGDANNAPKVNVTVAGNSGTAQTITTASTSVYGVTKLSSSVSNDNTTAITPAAVADAIASNTGDYISNNGDPFTSYNELVTYSAQHASEITNNDYAIVTGTDGDNTYYDRYKATVSGSTITWSKEYRINNSSFSTAQWDAINSGITSSGVTKLNGIAAGAEVNIQSNWSETNTSSDAFILNKPVIPTATSDLTNDSNFVSDASYIHTDNNYTTAEKNKLAGIASGAEVNVQADWNVTSTSSDAFIKNKPSLATVAISGSYNDLSNKPTIPIVNNGTLTIQRNGTDIATFTANQSAASTADIAVPTATSDLTNDSNFVVDASYVHTDNNFTSTEKTKLSGIASGAEVNQNAFSNVVIGSTTIAADTKTDTLTLVAGSNVALTPDATNDKITIAATDTTYSSKAAASGGTDVSLVTTGEKYTWNNKSNLAIGTTSTTAAAGNHTHTTSISAGGTSTVDLAADTSYTLTAGGTSVVFKTPANTGAVTGVKGNAESTYRTGDVNITPANIGAATSGHTHTVSIATSTGTSQITLAYNTKYVLTAGGSTFIFTTPPGSTSTSAYFVSTTLTTPVGTYAPADYYGQFFIDMDGRVWYATTNTSASEWKLIKSVWT